MSASGVTALDHAPESSAEQDDVAAFAKVVSHDFSGPLRAIRGFAGLLHDNAPEGADERNYLSEIITAASRMQALNDGLVACIRARSSNLEVVDVSLDSVVTDCLAIFATRITALGARVTATPLPMVRADSTAIRLVLHHLVDNALRHAHADTPVVTIDAVTSPTEWTITVRDNGAGIAEASREPAFRMFKRLEPQRDPGHAGVGLTLARTIVERHGGRLWVDAAPGGGTAAVFTLPADPVPLTKTDRHREAAIIGRPNGAGRTAPVQSDVDQAAIVQSSDDAMFSKDLDGRIITWNRAAEILYGYSAEEAIGQNVTILMPNSQVGELPALMEAVRTGKRTSVETVRRRKNGSLIDVSLTISPIRDRRGNSVAAAVVARDVTERHRVDEDLRAFLEVAPDAIVVISPSGGISAVNTQAETIFGYTRDELVDQPLEMLLPERFRAGHVAQRLGFNAEPTRRPMGAGLDLFGLKRDGTEFPVDIQLSSIRTRDGVVPVAAIRDVTERRRLEHLRDDFIGNAAHELRTPLTTLAGLGETLARSFDVMARTDIEDAFAAMERQGNRARVLIANLLDLSTVEGGRAAFAMGTVCLGPLIGRVLEGTPPPADKTVTVDLPDAITVHADPARLEQVVSNLLVNAYRYGGGDINVTAHCDEDRVILSVNDDGPGITPDFVSTIFEAFTRGKQANVVRGSGIGLALCRRIVQGMGGTIWYEPVLPRGTSFRVSLAKPS